MIIRKTLNVGIIACSKVATNRFIPALIGFNLGVEAGQILIILSFLVLMYLCKKLINFNADLLRMYGASSLACLGIYWFVERLF